MSKKYLAFIHIPKCAGTTIEHYYGLDSVRKISEVPKIKKHKNISFGHLNVGRVQRVLPNAEDYFFFTYVRNPYARAVSLWQHKLRRENVTFDEFLKNIYDYNLTYRWSQSYWVRGGKMDYIGRVEDMKGLPVLNKSKHDDYRSYYSDWSQKFVLEHFKRDFDQFNYSYEL